MQVLNIERLVDFYKTHRDAKKSLETWRKVVSDTDFEHFPGLKRTFGSASYVTPYTVFNICGQKYRLVTIIAYTGRLVLIKHALTHEEYNGWSESLRRR